MNILISLFKQRSAWKQKSTEEYVAKYLETAEIVEKTLKERLTGGQN